MNPINLKNVRKVFLGTGSGHIAVKSLWMGSNAVWPNAEKPVIDTIDHIYEMDMKYMLSVSWAWDSAAAEYHVFVDGVDVATVTDSWDQGEHGYWEGGSYSYGSTHTVMVQIWASSTGRKDSDTHTYTIADAAYTGGNTYAFEIVPSLDNIYGWTSGNEVKLYACFPSWPNNTILQHYADHIYPNLGSQHMWAAYRYEYVAGGVSPGIITTDLSIEFITNTVDVYPATISMISGPTSQYANVVLIDPEFVGEGVTDWTDFGRLVIDYTSWVDGNGNKHRYYPQYAQGGREDVYVEPTV